MQVWVFGERIIHNTLFLSFLQAVFDTCTIFTNHFFLFIFYSYIIYFNCKLCLLYSYLYRHFELYANVSPQLIYLFPTCHLFRLIMSNLLSGFDLSFFPSPFFHTVLRSLQKTVNFFCRKIFPADIHFP